MEHSSGREAVALQELLKATQARCKELEQQIHARQKSADDIRADLQRACEQQIEAVRIRASKQAEAHGFCKQALPAALSRTICEALFRSDPHGFTALFPSQAQELMMSPLEELVRVVVEDLWRAETKQQHDDSTPVQQKFSQELGGTFNSLLQQVIQQSRDAGQPGSERQLDQEAELQQARSMTRSLKEELKSCQGKLHEQADSKRKEARGLQLTVAELEKQLQQASVRASTPLSQQSPPEQPNAMNMVALMEKSLGNLSSAVRSKDAEIASLQNAMHEQFAERNDLRAQLSGVDSQLLRLQGSYSELEARLRDSEEERSRLQAERERSLKTEDRVYKRFRNRRMTTGSDMLVPSTLHGSHTSSITGSTHPAAPRRGTCHMHSLQPRGKVHSRTCRDPPSSIGNQTQQTQQGGYGRLPGIQGHHSERAAGRLGTSRSATVQAPDPGGTRRESVAAAVALQKQAVGRSSWLMGSGRALSQRSVRPTQSKLQTDLVQFQWEVGTNRH